MNTFWTNLYRANKMTTYESFLLQKKIKIEIQSFFSTFFVQFHVKCTKKLCNLILCLVVSFLRHYLLRSPNLQGNVAYL